MPGCPSFNLCRPVGSNLLCWCVCFIYGFGRPLFFFGHGMFHFGVWTFRLVGVARDGSCAFSSLMSSSPTGCHSCPPGVLPARCVRSAQGSLTSFCLCAGRHTRRVELSRRPGADLGGPARPTAVYRHVAVTHAHAHPLHARPCSLVSDPIGGGNGKPRVRRARGRSCGERLDGVLRAGHNIYGDQRGRIHLQAQRAGAVQHRQQHAKLSHRLLDITLSTRERDRER